jgi:hypothetical protein
MEHAPIFALDMRGEWPAKHVLKTVLSSEITDANSDNIMCIPAYFIVFLSAKGMLQNVQNRDQNK